MRLEDLIPKDLHSKRTSISEEQNETLEAEKTRIPEYLLTDTEVVGYPDLEMQENIYSYAIRTVLPAFLDTTDPIDVVDIGAGRGDLRGFLARKYADNEGLSGINYYGYELNSIHRNIAMQKYGIFLSGKEFSEVRASFKGWGFCIGSLNDDYGLFDLSEESKLFYFRKLLSNALDIISEGVVFILLNDNRSDSNLISFPVSSIVRLLEEHFPDIAYTVDQSSFHGIYRLVVYNEMLKP